MLEENPTPYFLSKCYFCANHWGECTCPSYEPETEERGFHFNGTNIIEPNVDISNMTFVNPILYYGQAYINWFEKLPKTKKALWIIKK